MSRQPSPRAALRKLPGFQRQAVEKILAGTAPVHRVPGIFLQWLAWLALAALGLAFAFGYLHPQEGLLARLTQLSTGGFLALVFAASALSAWMGIASSIPGREPGPAWKVLMGVLLVSLLAIPFLFFAPDNLQDVLDHNEASGWFCFRTVTVLAIPSWALLGWMAARNASLKPGWTGAWLGVSAFLLGTGSIQIHCSHWERGHVLLNHLLPMAVFLFLPVWIGSYWFARWERKGR